MSPRPETFAFRRRYFRGKLAEDAALFGLGRLRSRWTARLSHAVLARVHREVLEALRNLPAIEPGAGPPRRRLGVPHAETYVIPYDSAWPVIYEIEAGLIQDCLGASCGETHHIGSTAVPGLAAKPIIDIGLGLRAEDFAGGVTAAIGHLGKIGYRYLGNRRGLGGHYLEKGLFPLRTHALQLHPAGGPELARLLRFRDELRQNPALAAEYQAIKQALAALAGGDRRIYLWYKAHWVNGLLLGRKDGSAWGEWLIAHAPPSLYRMHWRRRRDRRPGGP